MTTLQIIFGIAAVIGAFMLLRTFTKSPLQRQKERMEKAVRNIPDAKAFYAVMAQKGRVTEPTAEPPQEVYVVRRKNASTKGYPHRCDYCGNPLYITDKNCAGCGAPRA